MSRKEITTEEDLMTVIDILEDAGITYWIDGGWGIDILAGMQTRAHRDIDINFDAQHVDELLSILSEHGYKIDTDQSPVRIELYSDRYGYLDIHPFVLNEDGSSKQADSEGGWYEFEKDYFGRTVFNGRLIYCISLKGQRVFHSGYELREKDKHDMSVLSCLEAYEKASPMQHKGTALIETKRLILRKFKSEDSEAAFLNWTSDDRVTEFLRWPTHKDMETTQKVINMWVDGYKEKNFYQWAIVLKNGEDKPIGTISVVEQNERLSIVHIGYCIGSKWWKQGITSEAFAGIIPFLFEQVKANRIESQHDPNNPNSGRVMQKCGLKYEGTLRKADISNKGIVDAARYSMLASEYFIKGLRYDKQL